MNRILYLLCTFLILATACRQTGKQPLVQQADYKSYLGAPKNKTAHIDELMAFWQKRQAVNPSDLVAQLKIAGLYAKRFGVSGNIRDILVSDSIYNQANQVQKQFGSSVYRSLATNAITRHRFKEAAAYLDTAFRMGDDKKLTVLQMSDAALECGSLANAKKYLEWYPNKNGFEYLSRKAKISDHEGDLPGAISLMKKAKEKVQELEDHELLCWVKTNLADYYSHNNELKKALALYREALATDPEYYHALKGIAWIAFSNDRNTAIAEEILGYLSRVHPVPDYDLMLAEIAEYRHDEAAKNRYTRSFIEKAAAPEYGGMYHKYLFSLFADELDDADKAMAIAATEINNRPTPEAYSWLSWAYYKKGAIEQAYDIQTRQVEGKCFEPDAAWRMSVICEKKGETRKAKKYREEARSSLFELGPLFETRLKKS